MDLTYSMHIASILNQKLFEMMQVDDEITIKWMKWYVRGWNMLQSLQLIKTHHNAVNVWDGFWCHAFGQMDEMDDRIMVDSDYCSTQSFDFSGRKWMETTYSVPQRNQLLGQTDTVAGTVEVTIS